jgi:hypothetical protein
MNSDENFNLEQNFFLPREDIFSIYLNAGNDHVKNNIENMYLHLK